MAPHSRPRPAPQDAHRVKFAGVALGVLSCIMLFVQSQRLGLDGSELVHNDVELVHEVVFRGNSESWTEAPTPGSSSQELNGDEETEPKILPLNISETNETVVETPTVSTTEAPNLVDKNTSETDSGSSHVQPEVLTPTPTPTPTPHRDDCYYERDNGLFQRITESARTFCAHPTTVSAHDPKQTEVTLVDAPGGVRATLFRDLVLDLTRAPPHRPVSSPAEDGAAHDPRFRFSPQLVYCSCDAFASVVNQTNPWDSTFAITTDGPIDPSLVCGGANAEHLSEMIPTNDRRVEITGNVVLLARRDDHNPFFQVAAALNAWLMMKALKWDPQNVTLIHLDVGFPSPIDELHRQLLSPSRAVLEGRTLRGTRLCFSGRVLVAPFETTGPMMQHLDDFEPCFRSELFRTFRRESFMALKVSPTERDELVVTIISRQPVQGRSVQRVWLNEAEILMNLRADYPEFQGRPIVFQSVEFAVLPLATQMQLMLDSDVVIGMHGAGMVNVLWTRPQTLVLEIFPFKRKRWGYRNLCQFLGCEWHEFRGGTDVRRGPGDSNANDKSIPYGEWRAFFGPLFHHHITKII